MAAHAASVQLPAARMWGHGAHGPMALSRRPLHATPPPAITAHTNLSASHVCFASRNSTMGGPSSACGEDGGTPCTTSRQPWPRPSGMRLLRNGRQTASCCTPLSASKQRPNGVNSTQNGGGSSKAFPYTLGRASSRTNTASTTDTTTSSSSSSSSSSSGSSFRGVLDNSDSLASIDWPDMISASGSEGSPSDSPNGSMDLQGPPPADPLEPSARAAQLSSEAAALAPLAAAAAEKAAAAAAGAGAGASTSPAAVSQSGNGSSSSSRAKASHNGPAFASGASSAGALDTAGAVTASTTARISLYCVAAAFDRRELESHLVSTYGAAVVRKYPEVMRLELSRGEWGEPGRDVFFFDYGVVACWGMDAQQERDVVRQLPVQCTVQPLPGKDVEQDLFRCTFSAVPPASGTAGASGAVPASMAAVTPEGASRPRGERASGLWLPPYTASTAGRRTRTAAAATASSSLIKSVQSLGGDEPYVVDAAESVIMAAAAAAGGVLPGGTASRRLTRRAEAAAAVAGGVAPLPLPLVPPPGRVTEEPLPPPAGPFSMLSYPPLISDDTLTLHPRHANDCATKLAVSYALAQSTKLSVFEKSASELAAETRHLPDALAAEGEVHLTSKEIGQMIGRVFVLKRSVNLNDGGLGTPEYFWYCPDHMQVLYGRLTEYLELDERVELLNSRFAVLQELLELLRAQEENRHGVRLELIIIWLIVVEVVLGFFELLELFGVIGPGGGFPGLG